MNFDFSAEQVGIRDALRRFVGKSYSFEYRRELASQMQCSREAWAVYAELGLLALPLPEEAGGLGGNGVDVMVVMQGFGEGLLLEPYVPTVVLSAGLLAMAGSDHGELLGEIAQGKQILAFAHFEPDGRYNAAHISAQATAVDGGWRISGHKATVYGAPLANKLVVSARVRGDVRDRDGIALFLLDANAPGLSMQPYRMHDGTSAAELVLTDVFVTDDAVIGVPGAALPWIETVLDRAVAAHCAEAVGIMELLNGHTVHYLQTRQQFGQPIGKFQALRHRAAEMAVHLEQARAMALFAAAQVENPDAAVRGSAVSGAKALISRCARFVGQEAVQLHGGMGLTDELVIGHGFKCLTMLEAAYGDTDFHLARYADALRHSKETEPHVVT